MSPEEIKLMKELWQKFSKGFFTKETLIYLIVGLTNTFIGWIETYVYNNFLHWGYWTTSIVVFVIGLIFTFVMNRKYSRRSSHTSVPNTSRKGCPGRRRKGIGRSLRNSREAIPLP